MDQVTLIIALIIGAIIGWLLAKVLKRTGFGAVGDIIIGMGGGVAGAYLWDHIPLLPEIGPFPLKEIVAAAVGAFVLLVLWRVLMLR
jgi:uncharacterized membrane protein YeaQ/YmgE (transglycosylase-associated protein family)